VVDNTQACFTNEEGKMANRDKGLYDKLRASGLRKKAAGTIAEAASAGGTRGKKVLSGAADELRGVISELEDRAKGGAAKRKATAKKAADTREQNAAKRSAAAKKAASTRSGGERSAAAKKAARTRAKG
jgi:hypothetical protein